tara:strand:- start:357 stop:647 length:291 start_codon:yes stop_codon:yes gene_type:complete
MQIYIVSWSFLNSEDQLFATKEFCNLLNEGKINCHCDGVELINCYHIPQDGTGVIICKTDNLNNLYKILKPWRENYNLRFNFKPALTNEEIFEMNK